MTRLELAGINGSNPLGFLASLGLLRVVPDAKLSFTEDGSFEALVEVLGKSESDVAAIIAADAESASIDCAPWRYTYVKAATEKQSARRVADLKPPPDDFRNFLATCINAWISGNDEAASYAAAYGTDIAVDHEGNMKPTAFHFTAAQQTFLGSVEEIRDSVTQEWVEQSLFKGFAERKGKNLRWNPAAERNWALMSHDPSADETHVDAPLEWLAFRGLPLLPSFPYGSRIITTGVVGRGNDMTFTWPLWSIPASRHTTRSLIQIDWAGSSTVRTARGIFAICSSRIRRTSQGFGNFGPSWVEC